MPLTLGMAVSLTTAIPYVTVYTDADQSRRKIRSSPLARARALGRGRRRGLHLGGAALSTIRDIARAADVSIATVSRVLNGSPRVRDAARRRVWAAADRLDYWPNIAARSLSTRRTHALGVLLPDLYGEFFSEVIRGIDQAARAVKLHVLISSSHVEGSEVPGGIKLWSFG